jgi:exopolysaccharide biosynthesis polyprenyl glycosylphosphotransferase
MLHPISRERAQTINFAADVGILIAASFLASSSDGMVHWKVALAMAAIATALWAFVSRVLRHYDVNNGRDFTGDLALTIVLLCSVALPLALFRLFVPRYASTTELSRFLIVMLPTIVWVRMRATGLRLWRSRPVDRVLIVGVGLLGRHTHREIRESRKRRQVIGYLRFEDEQPDPRVQVPILGTVKDLETVLCTRVVNEVYFANSAASQREDIQAAIKCCETFGIPFALPACGYRFSRAKPAHGISDGYNHFVTVQNKTIQAGVKRLIDIVASFTALVLLSPLLIATALAVKLSSRGPMLFKQLRVGLHGRPFHMLKFRSMVANAEELKARLAAQNEQNGPVFKMRRDPRVTRVGRFIRKFSIDELPQLVNVLRGEMSIVGPRPPVPSEVAKYEAWQRRRFSVRPGLTCVWQVSGRNKISFEDWMLLDMRYIDHWSLSQDIQLILKTFPVVFTGRGAS